MILRHTTPSVNVPSIEEHGLLPSLSRGASQAVWLHAPNLTYWALLHVSPRHSVPTDQLSVLTVSVPRGWLRRKGPGLWYCDRVIPPARIAGSPTWYAGAVVSLCSPGILSVDGDGLGGVEPLVGG